MDLSFYTQEVAPAMLRGLWVSIGLILPSAVLGLAIGVLAVEWLFLWFLKEKKVFLKV